MRRGRYVNRAGKTGHIQEETRRDSTPGREVKKERNPLRRASRRGRNLALLVSGKSNIK